MERSKIRRIFRKILRIVLKVVAVFAVLTLLLFGWAWYLNRPPHYSITPPAVPAINALTFLQRASDARRYGDELREIRPDWYKGKLHRSQQPQALNVLLEENRTSLQLIREGMEHQYVIPLDPQSSWDKNNACSSRAYSAVYDCRKLSEINALYRFQTADSRSAANALVDLIQFNTRTGFGRYYHLNGYYQLEAISNRLSVTEANAVVARLEQIASTRPSFADSLRLEKPYTLYNIVSGLSLEKSDVEVEGIDRWKTNRWFFAIPMITPSPLEDRSQLVNQFYNWTVPNAKVPGITDRYLTKCIRVAEKPFSSHTAYPSPPHDIVNWSCFSWDELDTDHLQWLMWQFHHDGVMLSLALHGYRREHGQYPVELEKLVTEKWIRKLPADPFTQHDTFLYRTERKTFTLYSRGPDGKDDHGKPITNQLTPSRRRTAEEAVSLKYMVHVDSNGDILYGINKRVETHTMRL